MPAFPGWLQDVQTVAFARFGPDGRLQEANQCYALLTHCAPDSPAAYLLEPRAGSLAGIYEGDMVVAEGNGRKHRLTGKIHVDGADLVLLVEPDTPQIDVLHTEISRLQQRLDELSRLDGLTLLANFRQLDARLDEELQRWERYRRPLSVIVCDIDAFSAINEDYGRETGDEVLQHIATLLRQAIRSLDLAARYGGQEFAIVLPETNDMGALIVAERLRNELESQIILPLAAPLTASFGVAMLAPGESREEFFRRATRALRHSKRNGRNCVTIADCKAQE